MVVAGIVSQAGFDPPPVDYTSYVADALPTKPPWLNLSASYSFVINGLLTLNLINYNSPRHFPGHIPPVTTTTVPFPGQHTHPLHAYCNGWRSLTNLSLI